MDAHDTFSVYLLHMSSSQHPSSTHDALCFGLLPVFGPIKSPITFSPKANRTMVHFEPDRVPTFLGDHGPLVWSDKSPDRGPGKCSHMKFWFGPN